MDDKNPTKLTIDLARTAKEVLPQTTSEMDGALSTLVGLFNNVVLYPVKKANITYRYKLECFEEELEKKTDQIPNECLHNPNLMIAGPTLEALKYTFDEESLRNMYVNLLASSMDSRMDKVVHPSYVDIIRQLNSFDAILFKLLSSKRGYIKALNPNIGIKETDKVYIDSMPEWFIEVSPEFDIFQTSASLVRLSKLGIIELMFDRTAGKDGYESLKKADSLTEILQKYQTINPAEELEIKSTESVIYVNEYGKQFAKVCLGEF